MAPPEDRDCTPTKLDESGPTLTKLRKIVTDQTVSVVVAGDDNLLREGVAALVDQWDEFHVVGKTGSPEETLSACIELQPNVCLINATLRASSMEFIEELAKSASATKIIVLSSSGSDDDIIMALRAGIHGYCIHNDISADRLRGMIWGIMSGGVMLFGLERSKLNTTASSPASNTDTAALDGLSKRETEVLMLLTQGLSNAEIGASLFLSEATVKKTIARIIEKLRVQNRVQAAVLAAKCLKAKEATNDSAASRK